MGLEFKDSRGVCRVSEGLHHDFEVYWYLTMLEGSISKGCCVLRGATHMMHLALMSLRLQIGGPPAVGQRVECRGRLAKLGCFEYGLCPRPWGSKRWNHEPMIYGFGQCENGSGVSDYSYHLMRYPQE